ncbi:MAG: hypothetical protein ACI9Y1_001895 [Lentisphaeria bacterium]|jgi:hypothetical protein
MTGKSRTLCPRESGEARYIWFSGCARVERIIGTALIHSPKSKDFTTSNNFDDKAEERTNNGSHSKHASGFSKNKNGKQPKTKIETQIEKRRQPSTLKPKTL